MLAAKSKAALRASRMLDNGIRSLHTCCLRSPFAPERPLLQSISYRRTRCRRLFATFCSAAPTPNKERKSKVIVISGPTGSGKSRLAMELAKRLNGEIISADSVQVYQGLDIGSAKPSARDRKEVPHHLIDILRPSDEYSVGRFFEDARQATRCILDNGRVPIVCGGTGLYLRWFMYGKPNVPKASPDIAAEVCSELADLQRNEDWDAAVQLVVKAGDPRAQHLAINDWYRLRRSYEIIKASGSPQSAFQVPYDTFRQEHGSGAASSFQGADHSVDPHDYSSVEISTKELDYEFICFFLSSPRLNLYKSIDFRCEDMILGSDGILSEATWLLNSGLLPNSNSATKAIGYRQAMEYLLRCRQQGGRSSPEEFYAFLSEFQKASRNFAKRQLTWFRNERIYHWLDASKPLENALNFIYDAYHNGSGNISVPDSLRMESDVSSRRKASEMKSYQTRNRYFVRRQDCADVLDWIGRTQSVYQDFPVA
ncbi:tRNA dimethylallyltransferase 9 [Cucumis melo var. makuwa]|uniref:tRNA dimethylallyltransferase n=3 Tax=Cucumis melo TaxID=3656 RepID=A0A1S3BS73_CUCME|nr:tRNA dimethylallyltransferase 9 isoform X1 [Cucumis melo]XP_050942956.1 tRNA dimethylallyltransferase 9 isoform X1 [Cucumis melo]KAA0059019.1 tRNA dimethylallyltransferase 9 [Cucumis melo var. makuwa]